MIISFKDGIPIYVQLAQRIEDDILKNIYEPHEQIPSTTEISALNKINPATANKGVNILVDQGILYKRRGFGMFVSDEAKEIITQKRKDVFYHQFIETLLEEAENLGISKEDVIEMIRGGIKNDKFKN